MTSQSSANNVRNSHQRSFERKLSDAQDSAKGFLNNRRSSSVSKTEEQSSEDKKISAGGTKPKVLDSSRNLRCRRESSSDDSVFVPQKAKVKYKTKSSPSESSKNFQARSLSSESDESVYRKRQDKEPDSHKARNARNKKSQTPTEKGHMPQKSRIIPQLKRSISSNSDEVFYLKSNICAHNSKNRDNSLQTFIEQNHLRNSESLYFSKSYSTIDNEEFLKKVDEVLSEIVEKKKREILNEVDSTKLHANSKPSFHQSIDFFKRRSTQKPNTRWVISKRYDTSEQKKSSFSHIITSHGDERLRRLSKSSDILETHRQCFTKLEPYKPRILRSEYECAVIANRPNYSRASIKTEHKTTSIKQNRKSRSPLVEKVSVVDRATSPRTDDQGSSTIEEQIVTSSSNNVSEADDTCYESEHGGSDGFLELGKPNSVVERKLSKQMGGDQAEASVDSAYTGSRGPTPDDHPKYRNKTNNNKRILQPNVPLNTDLQTLESKKFDKDVIRKNGVDLADENVADQIRREIINEVRDVGIVSDFAINTLLDLYRRKYNSVDKKLMNDIVNQIKVNFGITNERKSTAKNDSISGATVGFMSEKDSPKKVKVTFDVSDGESVCDSDVPNEKQQNTLPLPVELPNEAKELEEILDLSKKSDLNIRWLTHDEQVEAKWACNVLEDCGIHDTNIELLRSAATWQDVAKALKIPDGGREDILCGHEANPKPSPTNPFLDALGCLEIDQTLSLTDQSFNAIYDRMLEESIRTASKQSVSQSLSSYNENVCSQKATGDLFTGQNIESKNTAVTNCNAQEAFETNKRGTNCKIKKDKTNSFSHEVNSDHFVVNELVSLASSEEQQMLTVNNGLLTNKCVNINNDIIYDTGIYEDNHCATGLISDSSSSVQTTNHSAAENYKQTSTSENKGMARISVCGNTFSYPKATQESTNCKVLKSTTSESSKLNSAVVANPFSLKKENFDSGNSLTHLPQTEPGLKGSVAELADAYSSCSEDKPDWLIVADEVCKQFNIKL